MEQLTVGGVIHTTEHHRKFEDSNYDFKLLTYIFNMGAIVSACLLIQIAIHMLILCEAAIE